MTVVTYIIVIPKIRHSLLIKSH